MAKFYDKIGFTEEVETSPGIWEPSVTERYYRGDVSKITKTPDVSNSVNDGITVRNEISIVADPYAINNFQSITYINWLGHKWKISNVEVAYPRLLISIGGIYHG